MPAGMDTHPYFDRHPFRPVVREQRVLRVHSAVHCVARAPEGDEEGVALRVDLVAVMRGERRPQDPLVLGEHLLVAVAERLHQPRGALDVGEEEGDRAARELGPGAHALRCYSGPRAMTTCS
jgi:hypothetical protein